MDYIIHDMTTDGAIWGIGATPEEATRDARNSLKEAHASLQFGDLEMNLCDENVSLYVRTFGGDECPYYIDSKGEEEIACLFDIGIKELEENGCYIEKKSLTEL